MSNEYLKGRGAQLNTINPYNSQTYVTEHIEGLDEQFLSNEKTQFLFEYPKTIVNKVDSPDLSIMFKKNFQQTSGDFKFTLSRLVTIGIAGE